MKIRILQGGLNNKTRNLSLPSLSIKESLLRVDFLRVTTGGLLEKAEISGGFPKKNPRQGARVGDSYVKQSGGPCSFTKGARRQHPVLHEDRQVIILGHRNPNMLLIHRIGRAACDRLVDVTITP